MPGLMKRLSKSAGDLSPCKKKTRSNSYEEYQLEPQEPISYQARTDIRQVSSQQSNPSEIMTFLSSNTNPVVLNLCIDIDNMVLFKTPSFAHYVEIYLIES